MGVGRVQNLTQLTGILRLGELRALRDEDVDLAAGVILPGSEEEAAGLLDSYLAAEREQAEEAARSAGGVQNECGAGAITGAEAAHAEAGTTD
jgi:hypothetical protein